MIVVAQAFKYALNNSDDFFQKFRAALQWAAMVHKCWYSELRFGFLHFYEIIASNYISVLRLFMEEKKGKAKQPPTQQVFTC